MQMSQVESHKIKSPATNLIPFSLLYFLLLSFTLHLLRNTFLSLFLSLPPTGSVSLQKKKLNRLKVALSIDRPQQIIHSAGSDHEAASLSEGSLAQRTLTHTHKCRINIYF